MPVGDQRRFVNPAQPQTLQIAVFLLYINAAFLLLDMVLAPGASEWIFGILLIVAGVAAGYNIANERKFGYALGLVMAFLPFVFRFFISGNPLGANLISLVFEIALVALLLHPQSREYQRIWFK